MTPAPGDIRGVSSHHPEFEGFTALWYMEHRNAARSIVHALKYRAMPSIGDPLGRALGHRMALAGLDPVVVPVPLHRVRLRERGYNQAGCIAEPLSRALHVAYLPTALRRNRPSATQTAKGADVRRSSLDGAFEVDGPTHVTGRNVILVDDVLTTGSTASAAAAALLLHGARSVHLAVVGYTRADRESPRSHLRMKPDEPSSDNP